MTRPHRNSRLPLPAGLPLFVVLCFIGACAAGAPDAGEERGTHETGRTGDEASAADGTPPSVEEPAVTNQQPAAESPFTLGRGRADLTVEVPVPASAALGGDDEYLLVLDDLELLVPGAFYQLYLNLPEGSEPDPDGPHFLGNLSLFGPTPEQLGGGERPVRHSESFDVSDALRELASRGGWDGEIRLTFVRGNPAPATAAAEPDAFIRVGEVSVVRRD